MIHATAVRQKKAPASLSEAEATDSYLNGCSGRLDNGAGTDTTGANPNMQAIAAGSSHPDPLQIRQPTPSVFIVGMAHIIAGSWAFSTNRTFF
jgi:hypothetical protein